MSFRPAGTAKLAIDRVLLRKLAGTDFGSELLNEARDMFLFSFYARGMSFVDMAYMRREQIWDGALHYDRSKTHQMFSVEITPQMHSIPKRYLDSGSPWVLPCMKRGLYFSREGTQPLGEETDPATLYKLYTQALQYYMSCWAESPP